MTTPKIIDNDRDEITAELDGKEIRGWSYKDREEYRFKMRLAREFVEGWYQCQQAAPAKAALCEELADALRKVATEIGWRGNGENPDIYYCEFCGAKHPDSDLIEHTDVCAVQQVRAVLIRVALTKAGRDPQ